jgi:hypothetical protein
LITIIVAWSTILLRIPSTQPSQSPRIDQNDCGKNTSSIFDLPSRIPTASLGELSGEGTAPLFFAGALKTSGADSSLAARYYKSRRGISKARSERHVVVLKRNREKMKNLRRVFFNGLQTNRTAQ